jgi:hypothetical protein
LYDYILEGLENSRDFYNSQNQATFKSYLQSLQQPAKQLWESYRSSQVKVNYSEPSVQAAYLIRYYPHYVEMTFEILKQCSKDFVFEEKINACFFGAGPCPEVTGLAQFLTEYCPKTQELFVNVYDIASEEWALSRAVTRDLIPHIWKGKLSGSGRLPNFDFSLPNCFESITEVISNSHLFVFQNCFNEIENSSDIKDNIKFLLARAPLNSFVVIGDLSYEQNRHIIEDVTEFAQTTQGYKIIGRDELEISSSLKIPQIIKKNLLTGEDGLIPRSRIKFMFLVIRKS